jgi:hyperosmotically inducible periplasmic protein
LDLHTEEVDGKDKFMNLRTPQIIYLLLLAVGPAPAFPAEKSKKEHYVETGKGREGRTWLEREVRHELVTLPYYSVFDNLAFRVSDDGRVQLIGQVSRPTLKSDAERVVNRVEGVQSVSNDIEVLPTSPNDDRIRLEVYRAIYGNSVLQPYSLRSVPPIHIIVKNGNVTLEGVVAKEMEKNVANIQANGVPGVFSVTNNLQVEESSGK